MGRREDGGRGALPDVRVFPGGIRRIRRIRAKPLDAGPRAALQYRAAYHGTAPRERLGAARDGGEP